MASYPYFQPDEETQIAYIRATDRANLPKDVRDQTMGMRRIYSIHAADGKVLALVDDRTKAFAVARMNEMRPVSVH